MQLHAKPEYLFVGVVMKLILSGTDTDNQFCLFENRSEGKSATPVHVHQQEDETIYLLEGQMQAVVAGVPQEIVSGQTALLPKGVPHQLLNMSGQLSRYILLCTPGGFDQFVAECGELRAPGDSVHPPNAEEIKRIKRNAPRYGITLLEGW